MRDPGEGVGSDGSIVTGISRRAVPSAFEAVLADLAERLAAWPAVSSFVYGSVATGQARLGSSDVDLITVGLPAEQAGELGNELSARFADLCREVAIGPAQVEDLLGSQDSAYGMRVFVKHYCVHLGGPDPSAELDAFPADARAARGFNGDIDRHLAVWREAAAAGDPVKLGRRVGRKTMLATAGLVSILDSTWTTDRELAAIRYATHRPDLGDDLRMLLAWATDETVADRQTVLAALAPEGVVGQIVAEFRTVIGLWP